jgi:NodT family efflux transporter outer membrane factor (OMF) lipoprotein
MRANIPSSLFGMRFATAASQLAHRRTPAARMPGRGHIRLPLAIGACLLVLGCAAVGPDYRAVDAAALGVPPRWSVPPANPAPASGLATWWRALDDSTLDALIEKALANNRDIAVAQARLREARARRDLANANRFPTVGASASAARNRSSEEAGGGASRSLFDAGFDASWEPDLFGGQRRAVAAAEADLAASRDDLEAARVSLAAEVARNYVDVRSFQARLGIARANLDSQLETLQITQWRAQAGLTTSLDVEQSRAAVEQTRAQIPALETSLAAARNRIAILAGVAPGALNAMLSTGAPVPSVPAEIAVGIPADTLRQRPDLRAAERRVAAETARIGVQAAAAYPNLSLSGTIGLESLTLAGLAHGSALASQIAARLATTIFDAGRIRDQVEIQNAVQERALHAYEGAVLIALEDVENALVAFDNAEQRRVALGAAVSAARNAALYARQRYTAGITDFQTVLDTERTVLVAEDSLASTEADRVSALIQLYKALGGGWSGLPATISAIDPRKG